MIRLTIALIMVLATLMLAQAFGDAAEVDYPENYRTWQHVKTAIIQPGHPLHDTFGGIHHVYANIEAMDGLTGGEFDDGAFLVFDLLNYEEVDKVVIEKSRRRIDVMQYDRARFATTGGWGYGSFNGDSKTERVRQDVTVACYGCHTSVKESNYVFSQYRP